LHPLFQQPDRYGQLFELRDLQELPELEGGNRMKGKAFSKSLNDEQPNHHFGHRPTKKETRTLKFGRISWKLLTREETYNFYPRSLILEAFESKVRF
jgi:hypothetical protein